MTRWSPWDVVTVADATLPGGPEDDVHRLTIRVGGQAFDAWLRGEPGRRALRDFVAAVRISQPSQARR
jgi:hypothetical protein